MNKMFLEISSSYSLLITDGTHWYYFDESDFPVHFADVYDPDDPTDTDEQYARMIRNAIASGDMYDADDYIADYCTADDNGVEDPSNEHYVPEYDGCTLADIDYKLNYEQDIYSGDVRPRSADITYWIEI